MDKDIEGGATPFLAGLAVGELRYARCGACDAVLEYGASLCPACGAAKVVWVRASGAGRLRARAIYYRSYAAGLVPPYAVAMVELEEGPRLLARLAEGAVLTPGMALRASIEDGSLRFVAA